VNVVFTVVFVVPLLKRSNLSEEKRARAFIFFVSLRLKEGEGFPLNWESSQACIPLALE